MYKRLWNYIYTRGRSLLNLRDDKRTIARGVAVGVAMNFLPTIGLGVPVVYWVAAMARGNKTAAMISTMSIKCLFPLLYILNYIVGELLLERQLVYTFDWHVAVKAGASFIFGSLVNFILSYIVTYYLSLKVLQSSGEKAGERL